jgi:hypothetical protein
MDFRVHQVRLVHRGFQGKLGKTVKTVKMEQMV